MSGGGVETRAKGVQVMVGTGQDGRGKDADGGLGGRKDRGEGGYREDRDRERLSWWEDSLENITLGM